MTYDRGVLELMSPSRPHERFKKLLAQLVEILVQNLAIPYEAAGESRWAREAVARGLEPDECYFLSAEKLAVVGGRAADRPDDPVPDLAIEVDWSRPELDRMAIYASLGIPEVWRYDGERFRIDALRDNGTYEERAESRFLPIRADEVLDWLNRSQGLDMLAWSGQLRDWVRDVLAPRRAR